MQVNLTFRWTSSSRYMPGNWYHHFLVSMRIFGKNVPFVVRFGYSYSVLCKVRDKFEGFSRFESLFFNRCFLKNAQIKSSATRVKCYFEENVLVLYWYKSCFLFRKVLKVIYIHLWVIKKRKRRKERKKREKILLSEKRK